MTVLDLDANATTPLLPAAWDAMRPVMLEDTGNPSSAHSLGRSARRYLEEARETIAACLDAKSDEVIFTSGATEANNLAIFGLADELLAHIVTTPIEHPCVVEPIKQLENRGFAVSRVSVNGNGFISQNDVMAAVRSETRLISLILANHETGAIQPIRDIALSLPKSIVLHTDAAQAVGKIPVSFRTQGITALTASAHKFGGPKGIGVLVLKSGVKLKPLQFGGHQQKGFRPGTEPVALAVGMATALNHAVRELEANRTHVSKLRERLWIRVKRETNAVLNGPAIDEVNALPNTLNISFPGCRADLLLMALDLAGMACSTGSACSSGSLLPSPVLTAMGLPDDLLRSALRFSLSPRHTEFQIDDAAERIVTVVRRVRETNS
jgi:cysteine desulfurase